MNSAKDCAQSQLASLDIVSDYLAQYNEQMPEEIATFIPTVPIFWDTQRVSAVFSWSGLEHITYINSVLQTWYTVQYLKDLHLQNWIPKNSLSALKASEFSDKDLFNSTIIDDAIKTGRKILPNT